MQRVDCNSNIWLAEALVLLSGETNVFAATADCLESYGIDDLWISAYTTSGNIVGLPLENKTLKGGYQLKYEGEWNPYFSTSNPKGISRKISGETPDNKYVYFVNSSKYEKLIKNNACLAFTAPDGFLLFSYKSLLRAFLGNIWYLNKSHTEEFGERYHPHYEEKALLNLEEGRYYRIKGPYEIFIKNDKHNKT